NRLLRHGTFAAETRIVSAAKPKTRARQGLPIQGICRRYVRLMDRMLRFWCDPMEEKSMSRLPTPKHRISTGSAIILFGAIVYCAFSSSFAGRVGLGVLAATASEAASPGPGAADSH